MLWDSCDLATSPKFRMSRMKKSAASDGEERCDVKSHMIGGSRHRRGQRKLVGMKQVPLQTRYSHSCSIRGCGGFFFFFFVWYSLNILSGIGQLFHHFLDKELKSQDEDIYQVQRVNWRKTKLLLALILVKVQQWIKFAIALFFVTMAAFLWGPSV